ncbi:MAG: hypothetical protein D6683_10745, partial [Actinomyces sp.]
MSQLHEVQRPPTRVARLVAPTTLDEALAVLAERGPAARIVAGGTDLLVELDRGQRRGLDTLVDPRRIPGLDEIVLEDGAENGPEDPAEGGGGTKGDVTRPVVRIGALVTHNQVITSPVCRRHLRPLVEACAEVGSPALRNRATVVGNVVTASPANDTLSPLLVLGAECEIASRRGIRRVPLERFVTGFRTTDLASDEMVVGLRVPALASDERAVFVKAGLRRAQAISVVHLAALLAVDPAGRVSDARLALGAVAPTVITVPAVAGLVGRRPDEAAIETAVAAAVEAAAPIDDLRADAAYRRHLVAVMTRRALDLLAAPDERPPLPAPPCLVSGDPADSADQASAGGDAAADPGADPAAGPVGACGREVRRGDDLSATVDGRRVTAPWRGDTLLDWLRDDARIDAPKEGCAEGECGACTVVCDGAAVLACLVPAPRADGATLVTAAGLADGERLHPVQEAFVAHGAVQCGFCTPGFVVAAAALLDEVPDPDPDTVVAG